MRFIFFGTPEFAAVILEKLINADFVPATVICNPDKPVGRKKIITPPAVKQIIIKKFKDLKIKILQPEKLEIGNRKSEIGESKPDFAVVAAFAKIIPKKILEIPRFGTIGVHPSLLPKYRGPSPIQTAILNGDEFTGTTLYLMDEKIDHGKIISNFKSQISNFDTYETLMKKLAELGADLLINFLRDYENAQKYKSVFQNESQATYTKKFKTEDGFIKSENLQEAQEKGGLIATEIDRKIRALNPEPGTWTYTKNSCKNAKLYENIKIKRMKILEVILTFEKKLKLKKIQIEGGKPVEI